MKIERIDAIPVRVPFKSVADSRSWAGGRLDAAEHVIVRVYSDDGGVGYGEAPARTPIYGETQTSIVEAIKSWIAPSILGLDPFDREKIAAKLARLPNNHTAKGSVDVAVHDLIGRALGVPVYKLLGGWGSGRVPMVWLLHLASREKMVADSVKAAGMGVKGLKIKTGPNPDADIETVRAIREAVGPNMMLYIDANMAWTPEVAARTIDRLMPFDIVCVEEPLDIWNRWGKQKLLRSLQIPWLMDEAVMSANEVYRELGEGVVDMISVKTPRTGFYESTKIIHLAELASVPCIIGSQGETGVGVTASAHLASAFHNVKWMENANVVQWETDLLTESVAIEDGHFIVPSGPGLGVELDQVAIERFALGIEIARL